MGSELVERLWKRGNRWAVGDDQSEADARLADEAAATLTAQEEQIERLTRGINMAMGCLLGKDRNIKLAWSRLFDVLEGNEPRDRLEGSKR